MVPSIAGDSFELRESDLEIVNALQVRPRAPWSRVGASLGRDPSTLARRWRDLEDSGAAWVSCQPLLYPDPQLAYLEITASPGHLLDVAHDLAQEQESITIDIVAGGRDLIVTVACPSTHELAAYLVDRSVRLRNVASVRSYLAVHIYADASHWRLRSLTREQEHALRPAPSGASAQPVVPEPRDMALFAALSLDGRATTGELARTLGTSESTVRRRLDRLTRAGILRLRAELARGLTGWPVSLWLFARVRPDRLDHVGGVLASVPEVRAVLSCAGPYNLLVSAWVRTVADGQRLEVQIAQTLSEVEVMDRSVVIRPFKLAGRLLDERGFSIGTVPLRGQEVS